MFGSKRKKQQREQQASESAETPEASGPSGGYVITELPTFHGRQRKVVVYRSDATGKIITTFKK